MVSRTSVYSSMQQTLHNGSQIPHWGRAVYGGPALHRPRTHRLSDLSGPREWNTQDRQTETFIVPNYSRFLADTSIFAASLSANGFVECTLMSGGCSPKLCVLLLPTRHKFISEALLCFCCAHSEPGEE